MNQITILFYINAINGGGAERVITQLASHFAAAGYKSILVTSFVDKWEYHVADNVERVSLEQAQNIQSKIMRNITRIWKLRQLCKQKKPAVVISFMAEPNIRAICATIGLKTKNIISVRNAPEKEYAGRIGWFISKVILPFADGCVFQTEQAKTWFPIKLQRKSIIIYNEVATRFFLTERQGPYKDIVTLGRLTTQKNHELLIRAFKKIEDKYPTDKLLIYGEGELRDKLSNLIVSLELQERVVLMGQTSDVFSVLKSAKVFVLSSNYEGMPNALMEAMAVGVPSIATDCPCGGPKKLIDNGHDGLLIPPGDIVSLSEAIDSLLCNSTLAQRLSFKAKKKARSYHPRIIFNKWKDYIESIMLL